MSLEGKKWFRMPKIGENQLLFQLHLFVLEKQYILFNDLTYFITKIHANGQFGLKIVILTKNGSKSEKLKKKLEFFSRIFLSLAEP